MSPVGEGAKAATPEAERILAERRGGLGLLTINRPEALNALTHDMTLRLSAQLSAWERDPTVHAILLQGAGARAYCAGGDVRDLRRWAESGDQDAVRSFYRDEYRLNAQLARLMTPAIAVMHGVVMGGGAGVSMHARYRVGGPSTLFAMPEAAIGLAPDVGASYVLPRLPVKIGWWLGLTGARIGPEDALYAHLVDYLIAPDAIGRMIDALAGADMSRRADETICEALAVNAHAPAEAPIAAHAAEIEAAFAASDLDAALAALDAGSPWAKAQAEAIRALAPFAVRATWRLLREGADRDLEAALRLEYRLTCALAARDDFREGVRAKLVDRDGAPRWRPDRIEGVGADDLAAAFAPRPGDELTFR